MRSVPWGPCLVVLAAASCGSPRSSPLADGGAPGDAEPPGLSLELLAGDIGGIGNVDGTGAAARFFSPTGVAVDNAGNLYVADSSRIRKVTPAGVVTALTDSTGATATFNPPTDVAIDSAGNVYVVEHFSATLRKVTADGVVTTLAGTEDMAGSADGTGAAARFSLPTGVAVDHTGNIYVADTQNATIRKITPDGTVTTLAGTAGMPGSADGTGAAARFGQPTDVAVDSAGNVYVADALNQTIRKITPDGTVTTLAGSDGRTGSADGTGAAARFNFPEGVAVDGAGNVYVADTDNDTIRKITPDGVVTTLAGTARMSGDVDGTGPAARFGRLQNVTVDGAGNVYVADHNTLRKITPDGVVTALAGAPLRSGSDDGTGAAARFNGPSGVALDGAGNVYVADQSNNTIRKITPDGVVTTLAGAAGITGSADGASAAARFNLPTGVALDGAGNMYVADQGNSTIRKIAPGGVVTTLAGTPSVFGSVDGTGAGARFNSPVGVAVDGAGNIYVADIDNDTIRKITPGGVVTTLAGAAGITGSADGAGAAARFNLPTGVALDGASNVYVADQGNSTIRKITPDGVVTTLAGAAGMVGSADSAGVAARFSGPIAVASDAAGNVYVADTRNSTIRKITPDGTTTTIAGTPRMSGIVLGATPRLALPVGVAIAGDSLVITDTEAVLLLRHGAR